MGNRIDDEIFNTFSEKEEITFLLKSRKATEGMIISLIKKNNLSLDGGTAMLGSLICNEWLLGKLNIDINLKSSINYIRLYGNRAAHYQEYDITSSEIRLVRSYFIDIVTFFYSSIGEEVPKSTIHFLRPKYTTVKQAKLCNYNLDSEIYISTLIAVEQCENDYPEKGNILLSNILSKIVIDINVYIPETLFTKSKLQSGKILNVEKAILFINQHSGADKQIIAKITSLDTFFRSSSNILYYNNIVPDVPLEIKKTLIEVTDCFFKKSNKTETERIWLLPFFVDLFTIFMLLVSVIIGVAYTPTIKFINMILPSVFVFAGVLIFLFAYSYNIIYSVLPSMRNRTLFNGSRFISSYSGFVGVLLLAIISNYILHDGRPDAPYRFFFIATGLWAISLQISIFVNSKSKSVHDKILKVLSVIFLSIIMGIIIYLKQSFMRN